MDRRGPRRAEDGKVEADMTQQPRRGHLDICDDILAVASEPVRKTRIVYRANLNFVIVADYLETLIERGLLRHAGDRYQTTEAGREFRRRLAATHDILG